MFFHSMKYTFLALLRDKSAMFWCFAFPLILGTMFHFAFGGLGEDKSFCAIPVAVVEENTGTSTASASDFVYPKWSIRGMLDALQEGDDPFLQITYAPEEEALNLLEQKKVYGILYADMPDFSNYAIWGNAASDASARAAQMKSLDASAGAPLSLTISAEMNSDPLYQSILSAFVEQFNISYNAIAETAMTRSEKLPAVLETLAADTAYVTDTPLGDGSTDESLTYFFNLIAMICMFGAMGGSQVAISNQANLSALGARKSISPVHKLVSILGELSASLLFNFLTVAFTLLYLMTVLRVNFGNQFGFIAIASLCGCLAGISLGFFVGCIGRFDAQTKLGILMTVIMTGCVLSGLMIGNIRTWVEDFCPLLNRINPTALISDALYSLAVYPSHERFFSNIAGLLGISAPFALGGFLLVRRKKYASLSCLF